MRRSILPALLLPALLLSALVSLVAACSQAGPPSNPRQALIGRWGDVGNCAQPLKFNADGSFEYSGRAGQWRLDRDQLILSGAGGTVAAEIKWIDHDRMRLTRPDGSTGLSQRCRP